MTGDASKPKPEPPTAKEVDYLLTAQLAVAWAGEANFLTRFAKSVTDAGVLAGLKQLGLLEMGGSGIPRPQVSTLKIALPELIIDLSGSSSAGPE